LLLASNLLFSAAALTVGVVVPAGDLSSPGLSPATGTMVPREVATALPQLVELGLELEQLFSYRLQQL